MVFELKRDGLLGHHSFFNIAIDLMGSLNHGFHTVPFHEQNLFLVCSYKISRDSYNEVIKFLIL